MMSFVEEIVMNMSYKTSTIDIQESPNTNNLSKSKTLEPDQKHFFKKNLTLIPEIMEESMDCSDDKVLLSSNPSQLKQDDKKSLSDEQSVRVVSGRLTQPHPSGTMSIASSN